MPPESITIPGCSPNAKCLSLAHEVQGLPALMGSPQPCSWGTRIMSLPVGFCVCLCLLLWFSVFTSVWAGVGMTSCKIIPSGVNASTLFCQAGLVISYTAFSGVTPLSCITQGAGFPLHSARKAFVVWLWATAWVWFSGWFVFVFSSWCSSCYKCHL